MGIGRCNRNETATGHQFLKHEVRGRQNRIQVNRGHRCRGEKIDRPGSRMPVRLFHVNDAFVFRRFQLRKMRVDHRRPALMQVHVEEGCVHRRENQRDDRTKCGYPWHPRILLNGWLKVNASRPEFLFRIV